MCGRSPRCLTGYWGEKKRRVIKNKQLIIIDAHPQLEEGFCLITVDRPGSSFQLLPTERGRVIKVDSHW